MTAMLAVLLLASTLAPPATAAGASVAGRVHDQDGKPLAGAGVSLTPQPMAPGYPKLISADASGAFAFENVEPGIYLVNVSVAGYLPTRASPLYVAVRSSGERKQLDVRLVQPGALVGTVSGADGLPVENALVQAVTDPAVPWTGPGAQPGTGGTAQDGQFRIPNLHPGRYYVRALPDSARTDESGLPTDVRPSVLPEPVVISPGAETRVALQVRRPPVHRLCGRVLDAQTGAALAKGMINATHEGPLTRPGAASEIAADGSFCMQGLPSGTYLIRVFARTLGLSEPFPIDFELGDQDATGVVFKVGRALALRGRIVPEGGAWPTGLMVQLRGPASPPTATPVQDGRFEVSVYPGTYDLAVWAGPLVPALTSARLGARDVIERGIQVSPDDTALPELVIHLDARMTSIAGRVLDDAGRPVAGTMVALLGPRPAGGRRGLGIRSATTGLDGGYSIDGLAAGEYFLLAWPGGILELRDPRVFGRLEAEVARVRLEPPQPLRRDLRLSAAIEAVAASVTPP